MKEYSSRPAPGDIKNIKELGGFQDSKGGLRIGATVSIDELLESAVVHKNFPALTEAARGVASPQIAIWARLAATFASVPAAGIFVAATDCWYVQERQFADYEWREQVHAILGTADRRIS